MIIFIDSLLLPDSFMLLIPQVVHSIPSDTHHHCHNTVAEHSALMQPMWIMNLLSLSSSITRVTISQTTQH